LPHALIVDDDDGFQAAVAEVVREFGFSVDQADSLRAARGLIERRSPDVALVDLALPDGRGSELFVELSEGSDVVMITGNATLDSAVQALRETELTCDSFQQIQFSGEAFQAHSDKQKRGTARLSSRARAGSTSGIAPQANAANTKTAIP